MSSTKTYTATEFRLKHREALNYAELGIPVVITRGAQKFTVQLATAEGQGKQ